MASSLEKLEISHGVTVQWRSYELRPVGAPPISPEYRKRIESGRPQLYATAKERYGLTLNPGPFGINSRPALVGAKYAEHMGKGKAYHAAILSAYWTQAEKIDDLEVLAKHAVEIGLDRAEFLAALDNPAYDAAVSDDVQTAAEYGLQGVPALIFNEKYYVSGAQPLEVLANVVQRVIEMG
ncbi:MAG: DsbA family protein [Anaerolineae bacterium]|nr:DsbA family protein [Anaerolineae bacterium]